MRNEHDLFGAASAKLLEQEGVSNPALSELESGLTRFRRLPAERLLVGAYLLGCTVVLALLLLVPVAEAKPATPG